MTECKTYLSEGRIIATPEFIETNKLKFKEPKDIVKRMKESTGMFDFSGEVFITFLPFEYATDFLNDAYLETVKEGKAEWTYCTDIIEATQDFLDYMNFAWGKAQDERGISASRSIDKLSAWLFVLDREDLSELIHEGHLYNPYGAPALIEVCKQMKIPVPKSLVKFSKTKC